MKINKTILILFVILISCKSGLEEQENSRVVAINLDDSKPELLSRKVKSIEYLLLNYVDSLPIVNPTKIMVLPNRIYVCDHNLHNIFIFDRKGKVINVIESKGEGPQEFNYINDFIVDDRDIVIFDTQLHKIIRYKENGKFISEERTNIIAETLVQTPDFRLFYMNYNTDAEGFNFVRITPDQKVSAYLPIKKEFEEVRVLDWNAFVVDRFRHEYAYKLPYTYNIVFFNKDGSFKELVHFDLGDAKIDEELLLLLRKDKPKLYELRETENRVIDISDIFPIRTGYYLELYRGNKFHYIFLDEKLNIELQASEFKNDLDGMRFKGSPRTYGDNELIYATQSPTFFNDYMSQFKNKYLPNEGKGIHEFVAKNKLGLQEEKYVLTILKLQ
ncbi:6-bladed beta-propeller [Algoriphagus sp. C2-6-M1]|uniref:6-bladed beta-propeller n=1 Tax=Algoriphagus persicinus TaxID=3108754 RepID=UPI002B3A5B74|nr:6-bladed beta-propeller [Algoriphagus sp. C2-6-M1]MEB2782777.1 6-bladed beta-propeller [Algoriphagus sp. C2-6-M1]